MTSERWRWGVALRAWMILSLFLLGTVSVQALENGSFEELAPALKGWQPGGAGVSVVLESLEQNPEFPPSDGDRCARVTVSPGPMRVLLSTTTNVAKGSKLLQFAVRSHGVRLRTSVLSSRGVVLGKVETPPIVYWRREFIEFVSPASDRVTIRVEGTIQGGVASSACWFDDFRVAAMETFSDRAFLAFRRNLVQNGEFSRKSDNGAIEWGFRGDGGWKAEVVRDGANPDWPASSSGSCIRVLGATGSAELRQTVTVAKPCDLLLELDVRTHGLDVTAQADAATGVLGSVRQKPMLEWTRLATSFRVARGGAVELRIRFANATGKLAVAWVDDVRLTQSDPLDAEALRWARPNLVSNGGFDRLDGRGGAKDWSTAPAKGGARSSIADIARVGRFPAFGGRRCAELRSSGTDAAWIEQKVPLDAAMSLCVRFRARSHGRGKVQCLDLHDRVLAERDVQPCLDWVDETFTVPASSRKRAGKLRFLAPPGGRGIGLWIDDVYAVSCASSGGGAGVAAGGTKVDQAAMWKDVLASDTLQSLEIKSVEKSWFPKIVVLARVLGKSGQGMEGVPVSAFTLLESGEAKKLLKATPQGKGVYRIVYATTAEGSAMRPLELKVSWKQGAAASASILHLPDFEFELATQSERVPAGDTVFFGGRLVSSEGKEIADQSVALRIERQGLEDEKLTVRTDRSGRFAHAVDTSGCMGALTVHGWTKWEGIAKTVQASITVEDPLQVVERALQGGDDALALSLLDTLADERKSPDLWLRQAKLLLKVGAGEGSRALTEAVELLGRAESAHPESGRIKLELARLHQRGGDGAKALAAFESYCALQSVDGSQKAGALLQMAAIQQQSGRFDQAMLLIERAREADPSNMMVGMLEQALQQQKRSAQGARDEEEAPVLAVADLGGKKVLTDTVSLVITAKDNVAVTGLSVDGQAVTILPGKEVRVTHVVDCRHGVNEVVVKARDGAGGTADARVRFEADLNPPVLEITSPSDGAILRGPSCEVVGRVSDDSTITSLLVGGREINPGGDGTFKASCGLPEGASDVVVEACDEGGRRSRRSVRVVLDALAPTITVVRPSAGAETVDEEIVVEAVVEDEHLSSISLNDRKLRFTGKRASFQESVPLAMGPQNVIVRAWDRGGNETVVSIDVVRKAPAIAVASDGGSDVDVPADPGAAPGDVVDDAAGGDAASGADAASGTVADGGVASGSPDVAAADGGVASGSPDVAAADGDAASGVSDEDVSDGGAASGSPDEDVSDGGVATGSSVVVAADGDDASGSPDEDVSDGGAASGSSDVAAADGDAASGVSDEDVSDGGAASGSPDEDVTDGGDDSGSVQDGDGVARLPHGGSHGDDVSDGPSSSSTGDADSVATGTGVAMDQGGQTTDSAPDGRTAVVAAQGGSAEDGSSSGTARVSVDRSGGLPKEIVNEKDGARMVLVPEGQFSMGATEDGAGKDEGPIHPVVLSAYYIDVYEVTNEQYLRFCKETGHPEPPFVEDEEYGAPKMPVVGVSHADAQAYCKWAGKQLPTEAQWERAARGMDQRTYPWGKQASGPGMEKLGNFEGEEDGFEFLAPVGSHPEGRSPVGCHDMAGNVREWCRDWYHQDYYRRSARNDPRGPEQSTSLRVMRGGHWDDGVTAARSSDRDWVFDAMGDSKDDRTGFRCVKPALR